MAPSSNSCKRFHQDDQALLAENGIAEGTFTPGFLREVEKDYAAYKNSLKQFEEIKRKMAIMKTDPDAFTPDWTEETHLVLEFEATRRWFRFSKWNMEHINYSTPKWATEYINNLNSDTPRPMRKRQRSEMEE